MKTAESTIGALVPLALPIVSQIAALTPNRTDDEIVAAFQKFGVPLTAKIQADPATALRDLAVNILQANHAPDAAVSLLNATVELAFQGFLAEQKPVENPALASVK